jgi:hypothetical protein
MQVCLLSSLGLRGNKPRVESGIPSQGLFHREMYKIVVLPHALRRARGISKFGPSLDRCLSMALAAVRWKRPVALSRYGACFVRFWRPADQTVQRHADMQLIQLVDVQRFDVFEEHLPEERSDQGAEQHV